MKREFFFWLEKLKITPAERQSVTIVIGLLLCFGSLNALLSPAEPFAGDQYKELEQQFEKRTAMLELEKKQLQKRYFPSVGGYENQIAVADTTPPDEKKEQPSNRKEEQTETPDSEMRDKGLININIADRETLKTLPGIGPTYSKRIIKYREENGSFEKIEELKKIKGIAEKRLEKLKPFIKLRGSD